MENWLVFLHILYILVEKQTYLMSTSSYQLIVKSILFLTCVWFWWCLEKSCETKWRIVTKYYITVILDNQTMWGSLVCKEWVLLCITSLFILKEGLFYFILCINKANMFSYVISPQSVILYVHSTYSLLSSEFYIFFNIIKIYRIKG